MYAGHIFSNLLGCRNQLRIAPTRYEDEGALSHKLLRRRKTDATIATGDERDFSFERSHVNFLDSW
jgi:hypothetical protein